MVLNVVPVQFRPGAVTAGTNIDLPPWVPKIGAVLSAEIWRLPGAISIANHATGAATHAACAATSAAYPSATSLGTFVTGATHTVAGSNYVVACAVTVVDDNTIRLNVDTVEGDVLCLRVIPQGAICLAS